MRYRPHVYARGADPSGERFPFDARTVLGKAERWSWEKLGLAPSFERQLSRQRPALVHAHFGTNASYATRLVEARRLPLVVTFHGHDVGGLLPHNRDSERYRGYQKRAPRMFEYSRLNLPVSREFADMLVSQIGIDPKRVVLHRIGIDVDKFPFRPARETPPIVLMVGRFVEKKGFEFGIAAFAEASKRQRDMRLLIVGSGPREALYKSVVEQQGIGGQVEFKGPLPYEQVQRLMAESDILLAPSVTTEDGDREGGLTVVKEASACGLGIVASHHGGIVDIVEHEQTGLLAPEKDSASLARYLTRYAEDFGMRVEFGKAARQKVDAEYNSKRQTRELEELFDSVL
jgi:glycosyltransferase involved in cell wall biosynthesis